MRPIWRPCRCRPWIGSSRRPGPCATDERLCLARRRLPLRRGAVRGGAAGRGRGAELQLLDLRADRLRTHHRAEEPVPAAGRPGGPDQLPVQHRRCRPSVLPGLRREEVLTPALQSRRLVGECALPGRSRQPGHPYRALRWKELGGPCRRSGASEPGDRRVTDILMPALSPTMEEGTLAKWLVKAGDKVRSGDVIAEIETDKATMEVEAVDEGVVDEILIPEGTEEVKVNTPIARLKGEGGASAPAPSPTPPSPPAGGGGQAEPGRLRGRAETSDAPEADKPRDADGKADAAPPPPPSPPPPPPRGG